MTETPFTLEMLEDMLAAFNAHDLEKVMSYFADDAVMISPAGNFRGVPLEGKAAIHAAFEKRFAAQPDVQWNDAVSFLSGNRAYTSWRVTSGTAKSEIIGCDVWTFANGRVVEKDVYYKAP